ncbi:MAG: hypothetical protein QS721_02535 [Candidatus Endonucleobacter sp. (ex Gigantidas childressi)]|nr:hypothetical protein [Candidatus Endonucleobacter sp. (ex Gigantidas childressi)]
MSNSNRLSLIKNMTRNLTVFIFYLSAINIFPAGASGPTLLVDDSSEITSSLVYGLTPPDEMLSTKYQDRQQKMEDFIVALSTNSGYKRLLTMLELELNQRPVNDILSYLKHHQVEVSDSVSTACYHEFLMRDAMNEYYKSQGKAGLLQYLKDLFQLEENQNHLADSDEDPLEAFIEKIDDSKVKSHLGEITLFAIQTRLVHICKEHNIQPKLACQKGFTNKALEFTVNKCSNVLINAGKIFCAAGVNEYLLGSLATSAEYTFNTSSLPITDCYFFTCPGNLVRKGDLNDAHDCLQLA